MLLRHDIAAATGKEASFHFTKVTIPCSHPSIALSFCRSTELHLRLCCTMLNPAYSLSTTTAYRKPLLLPHRLPFQLSMSHCSSSKRQASLPKPRPSTTIEHPPFHPKKLSQPNTIKYNTHDHRTPSPHITHSPIILLPSNSQKSPQTNPPPITQTSEQCANS